MLLSTGQKKSSRNRTLILQPQQKTALKKHLRILQKPVTAQAIENTIIHQDSHGAMDFLPDEFVDLMVVDPPYNINKTFNGKAFRAMKNDDYQTWLDSWLKKTVRLLKPQASVYICGDWQSSAAIFAVASRYFKIRNRITFERDKGRGAKHNWKNCSEDIWFCTVGDDYYFDVEAVKMKRKVVAPYRDSQKQPKDWHDEAGDKYRLTHPSNLWSDITIPFWSMAENTEHPTQKPEKLCAKLILASSRTGDMVFDPFLGSGTTAVVAKKLGRRYCGIEIDEDYCCLAQHRINIADSHPSIQGYHDGVFWERNSGNQKMHTKNNTNTMAFALPQEELI